MKWALIIKIFFSIRKFVGCPAVNFSRGCMNSERKSDLSHYFQDKKWVARLAYLSDIFSYINELNLKLQGPDTTIFNAWNKIESFKKNLKLWLKETMIWFSCTQIHYGRKQFLFTEFSFRYYYTSLEDVVVEHEDPQRQNMWIVNPFVEHKKTALSHDETLQLIELSSDKGLESTFNSISNSKFWIRMKTE